MGESFFVWLSSNSPELLGASALTFTVWFLASLYFNWKYRLKHLELKTDGLTVRLDQIDEKLDRLSVDINNILAFLKSRFGPNEVMLYMSRSPTQLTPLGERVLDLVGGTKYIAENEQRLMREMEALPIKTALDAQAVAPSVIHRLSVESDFNPIKDYLFQFPVYRVTSETGKEVELSLYLANVILLMGFRLRDKYLELYPDLVPKLTLELDPKSNPGGEVRRAESGTN